MYEPKQLIIVENIAKINEWIDSITLLHLNLSVNDKQKHTNLKLCHNKWVFVKNIYCTV